MWALLIRAGFQPRREQLGKVNIFLALMFVFVLTLMSRRYPVLNEGDVTGASLASGLSCLTGFM